MATRNANVQVRLTRRGRWLLKVATVMARLHMRLPHRLVKAVVDRSWRMRTGLGPWVAIEIDDAGRIIK